MDGQRPNSLTSRRLTRTVACILAIAGAATSLPAQNWYGGGGKGAGDPSGREFGGQQLSATLQRGNITLSAQRGWAWSEGGSANMIGPDGLPVSTQRLLLQGDVRVNLGGYTFGAAQAVVWVQTVAASQLGGNDPDAKVRQVAVYFDRVSDPGAEAGFSQAADRLLVTGRLDGLFSMRADALATGRPGGPVQAGFVGEAEKRFGRYMTAQATGQPDETVEKDVPPTQMPGVISGRMNPGLSRPYEPNSPIARKRGVKDAPEIPIQDRVEPLFAKDGVVTFAVGTRAANAATAPDFGEPVASSEHIRLVRGEAENGLFLSGGIALQYTDLRKTRNLLITAERAVVFLAPGPLTDLARFDVEQIQGVYLEGDVVATDGQYTLRGPRVYYDFLQNKAVMADAVFSTVDPRTGLPVYVRAQSLKQEAANKVSAEQARLSTTSFFDPVFSIGASKITVTQTARTNQASGGGNMTFVEAKNITLRGFGLPFFWLPGFKGEIDEIPLEDIRVENSSGSGAALKTTWNAFSLFGLDKPEGLKVRLLLDEYFDRGFAFGTRTDWKTEELDGQVFGYLMPVDDGRDVLVTGVKKEQDQETRGMVLAENRWTISPNWTLFAEGAYISDETFIDGFFDKIAEEGREVTNAVNLRYIESNSTFSLMAKGTFNDFSPNQYIQQSQGFTVNKLPEAKYARLADDLLGGVQPGMLTWTHEYSYSRVGFSFDETTANEFGFTTDALAQKAFGINANQSLGDRLRAAGFNEKEFNRFDTRQELSGVFDMSVFRVNPFVVGRFTGYDQKFGDIYAFSGDAEDQYRGWWAAGSRFSTQIVRVDDSVESSLFDLHRIRHIIEPSATVWTAGSNIKQESLAVYDPEVEGINTGSAVRAGVSNTWQTQRGGPGRYRSVDVLKINTDFTFSTEDINTTSPFGRFFDYRPEYSQLGNYFTGEAIWQATDAVGLTFNTIYDFDVNQPVRTTAGGIIQHSPEFSTYAQVRYLNPFDTTYVDFGVGYQLTRVYSLGFTVTYDTDENEVQNVNGVLRRKLREATLGLRLGYNEITEETSMSVVIEPQAVSASQRSSERVERLREIGR